MSNYKIPKALFNSKALFNPYQYLPYNAILKWDKEKNQYIENKKNLLVTDEVGVGKTFEIGIILREMLHWNPDLTVLILCPVKLCENWEKELVDNFYIGATNYYRTKSFAQITILPYSFFAGKSKTMIDDIKNERIMRKDVGEEDIVLPEELCDILPYDLLILDEAHYIRNKGKLWKCINGLIEESEGNGSKTKIFMTGTPVFNNEHDYESITGLLTKELPQGTKQEYEITKTLQSEANCYDTLLNINVWKDSSSEDNQNGITPSDIEADIINELYATTEKEDEDGNTREVSKYGRLTGFLKRIASSSIYSLKKFVESRKIEDFLLDISQYEDDSDDDYDDNEFKQNCDDLNKLLKNWKDDTKLKALKGLIESEFKNNGNKKAIIFSCFINTCKYLEERLKEQYHVYLITGETSTKNVEITKSMFERDDKPSILICSDAAKEGHNLQFCQLLIHYDLPYTPAAIGQRNGRIYRRGQEGIPKAYYMLFNQGYDLRLFGEIIVGKCQVIKNLEQQNKLSWINILPNDANDYIKNCTQKYIEEKLNESNNEVVKVAKALLERKFSELKIDSRGKKVKDEEGIVVREWNYNAAEILFNKLDSDSISNDDVVEELVKLFTARDMNSGSTLQEYYQKKYQSEQSKFCQNFFDSNNLTFSEACNKFVKDKIGSKERYFCHDMINGEKTITEYKKQFEPLKEWEDSANGTDK